MWNLQKSIDKLCLYNSNIFHWMVLLKLTGMLIKKKKKTGGVGDNFYSLDLSLPT